MSKNIKNGEFLDSMAIGIFSKRAKELRTERGLTMVELSKYFNKISRSTISMFEIGKRVPDLSQLNEYATFFDVSIDFLVGKTDMRKPLYAVACFSDISNNDMANLSPEAQEDIKKFIEYVIAKDKK